MGLRLQSLNQWRINLLFLKLINYLLASIFSLILMISMNFSRTYARKDQIQKHFGQVKYKKY